MSRTAFTSFFFAQRLLIVDQMMSNSDDEYIPEENSPPKTLTPIDSTSPEKQARRVSPCHSAGKKSYVESLKSTLLPDSLRSVKKRISFLSTKLLGHDIDENLSIRIILAALELQKNYLKTKQKLPVAKRGGSIMSTSPQEGL